MSYSDEQIVRLVEHIKGASDEHAQSILRGAFAEAYEDGLRAEALNGPYFTNPYIRKRDFELRA